MREREICPGVKCETKCEFCSHFLYFAVYPVSLQRLVIGKHRSSFNSDRVVDRRMTFYRPSLSIICNLVYLFIRFFVISDSSF